MTRLCGAVLVFAFCCLGAIAQHTSRGYNSRPNEPSLVEGDNASIIELIANPLKYNNQRVRIIGFLNLEFEGNAIYLHREDFEHSIQRKFYLGEPA
jgi:hypothetical protein